jgi:Ca-activated chloride channel homolog
MKRSLVIASILLLAAMLFLSGCASSAPRSTTATTTITSAHPPITSTTTTSAYTKPPMSTTKTATTTIAPTTTSTGGYYTPSSSAPTATIGLSTGGAKDIANFRENIRNNYLPLPTDVSYEGLFYDYFFETGQSEPSNKLFSPSYSCAVTRDPISHQTEYYMSIGLNSGLRESDFQRKKLNLVIVLDNSGSMAESFNRYYYDRAGNQVDLYTEDGSTWQMKKIESATQSVVAILDQLRWDDRFAIVTFNSNTRVVKPMGLVDQTDMNRIRNMVLDINAGGSTNLDAGLNTATDLFRGEYEINNYEYENRIIVLTDAQPNTGDISAYGFTNTFRRNADNRIYSTVIGIGLDFNSQLIEEITKTKGANYYSVHSPREFRQRLEDEFEYMVTPLVFNVQMNFSSQGWAIDKVFGSPEADQASGRLMTINTLFPSKSEGGETRGGLVLLKLRRTSSSPGSTIYLRVSYEDRDGRQDSSSETINLETWSPEWFDNSGIRKGVLLTRYAALLKNWMMDERDHWQWGQTWDPCVREDSGIVIPVEYNNYQWERQSWPLTVSEPYKRLLHDFATYFGSETQALGDNDLYQELDILNYLSR